jgi:hypothetical protein
MVVEARPDKFRRGYMVELIGVHSQKPVTGAHPRSRLVEHPATQSVFGKIDRIFFQWYHSPIFRREILHDLPGFIGAASVEHIDRIRPRQQMPQGLADNVGLVTDR